MTKKRGLSEERIKAIEENIERTWSFADDFSYPEIQRYSETMLFRFKELLKYYYDRDEALEWKEVLKRSWNKEVEKRGLPPFATKETLE